MRELGLLVAGWRLRSRQPEAPVPGSAGGLPGHRGHDLALAPGPRRALAGAAALTCFYLALALIRPDGIGMGDAKLAASIGLVLGWTSWQAVFAGAFDGFALAALYGGVQLAMRRATRTSQLRLGPFIFAGAFIALVLP